MSTSKQVEALKQAQLGVSIAMTALQDAAGMGVPVDNILDLCREVRKRVEASTRAQEQIEGAR